MSEPVGHRRESAALGIIVIVVTAFAMAFGDAFVKYISADFTIWQIFVLRSVVAIPLALVLLSFGRRPLNIRPRSIGWTFLRSALLVMMWIAFYAALPVLSLPVVAAAYYTGPLFITLFSAFLIGEPVGPRRAGAILIGFVGVLVILRPGTNAFSWFTLLPIVSALFYALAAIVTRTRCRGDGPLVLSLALNVCFMAVGAMASGAIVVWDPTTLQTAAHPFLLGHWPNMGGREWAIMVLLAVLIVATSSGVAKAYQCGQPAIIATFDYTYLVFAAFWSFIVFAEIPDALTALGMLLIAAAGVLAVSRFRTTGRARAANQSR